MEATTRIGLDTGVFTYCFVIGTGLWTPCQFLFIVSARWKDALIQYGKCRPSLWSSLFTSFRRYHAGTVYSGSKGERPLWRNLSIARLLFFFFFFFFVFRWPPFGEWIPQLISPNKSGQNIFSLYDRGGYMLTWFSTVLFPAPALMVMAFTAMIYPVPLFRRIPGARREEREESGIFIRTEDQRKNTFEILYSVYAARTL